MDGLLGLFSDCSGCIPQAGSRSGECRPIEADLIVPSSAANVESVAKKGERQASACQWRCDREAYASRSPNVGRRYLLFGAFSNPAPTNSSNPALSGRTS